MFLSLSLILYLFDYIVWVVVRSKFNVVAGHFHESEPRPVAMLNVSLYFQFTNDHPIIDTNKGTRLTKEYNNIFGNLYFLLQE